MADRGKKIAGHPDANRHQIGITRMTQPVAAEPVLNVQHPQDGAVALLGMRPVAHRSLNQNSNVIAHPADPRDQILWGHAAVALMRFGHVFLGGGMAAAGASTGMDGDTLMVAKYLGHPVR